MKAKDRAKEFSPQMMTPEDVPAVPEIEANLKRVAQGRARNLYTGWLDKPGTVRVRCHIPGDYKELAGRRIAYGPNDLILATVVESDNGDLGYFEYESKEEEGKFKVRVWTPAEADHDGIVVILG